MAWGGNRLGSGRPKGGVSQTRLQILRAIELGMADAAKIKHLPGATTQELALAAASAIVSDMIIAGMGDQVLKLQVLAAPSSDDPGGEESSLISRALSKLPGMDKGTVKALDNQGQGDEPVNIEAEGQGTTKESFDVPSVSPVFLPQLQLINRPSAGKGDTPLPPPGASPYPLVVDTENLEKNDFENAPFLEEPC